MTRTKLVVFRVDSSLQIGNGHVMRCLTLATALREQGVTCHFICRKHPGNLIDQICNRGFPITSLTAGSQDFRSVAQDGESLPAHATWLGVDWQTDAEATRDVLQSLSPDSLIVDHYALDRAWEQALRSDCAQMMVIDDLADRRHDCDLLLDQNLGREVADYAGLVPATCTVLTGARYALLRPEFAALREYSLQRRNQPQLRQLLITMGGVDQSDATGQVLDALRQCPLPQDCRITVVMGLHAPWLAKVQAQAADSPWPCEVKVNVTDMAQLMADSDLAIGAAGGTSWERCVLGLPTLVVVLAENQRPGAVALGKARAALVIDGNGCFAEALPNMLATIGILELDQMAKSASSICDGCGTSRAVAALIDHGCQVRPMCEDDLAKVLHWRNHPDVRRFMYSQHEISLTEHRTWYECNLKNPRHHLLIVEDEFGPFGFVRFFERETGVAEWGFYLAPGAPPGSGRRLGIAALTHAFQRLGFDKVCGEAIAFNERSLALHRKLGFQEVGVLRNQYFDGKRHHDVYRFSKLVSEWYVYH